MAAKTGLELSYSLDEGVSGFIAGVDEAGRGPLAGDVVAAAVIIHRDRPIEGLNDSKKLSAKRREQLYECIIHGAVDYSVGRASVEEIDTLNILHASLLAMKRAVEGLKQTPVLIYVDGNRCPEWTYASQVVVGGDGKVTSIAAASILAKVTRDREMEALSRQYPQYGFAAHKGYPTPGHLQSLKSHGPCPVHRRSFAPVSRLL